MVHLNSFSSLFQKYTSGTCTPEERELFFNMIKENPNNFEINALMDTLYDEIKKDEILTVYKQDTAKVVNFKNRFFKIAAAAVFVGGIITAAYLFFGEKENFKDKLAGNIHQTEKAQNDYLLLPDSTQIWLKAASDVRYPKKFDKDKREIYLEGEAFVDVKHADDIPFIIHLPGKISITVLGTAFNIKAFKDRKNAIISVARGKVRVEKDNQILSTLEVGEELRVSMEANVAEFKTVPAQEIKSWESGNVYFNDIPLQDVVKDLSLQYNVNIEIGNEKLGQTIINTGFSKNTGIKEIISIIKSLTDCNVEEKDGGFKLY